MTKVTFIKNWGKFKKGDTIDTNKSMIDLLLNLEVIDKKETMKITGYNLLLRYGLNPTQSSYTRNTVINLIKFLERKKHDHKNRN